MGKGRQMDWFKAVDGYCERVDVAFWSEPINAITNVTFLIAAIWVWRRPELTVMGRVLTIILALIGIGSFLFHTFAQTWAGLADVLPIMVFILVYIYVATRDYFHATRVFSFLAMIGFFPFAAGVGWLISDLNVLGSTRGYIPVPILILIYAYLLRHKMPDVARGLTIGVGILVVSMVARWADEPLCQTHPMGTHFLWHILNAVMLAWMIEVYRRHMLAGNRAKR
jgi:hypothetical protein